MKKANDEIQYDFTKGIPVPKIEPEQAKAVFGEAVAATILEIQTQKKAYDAKRKSN